MRNVNRNVSGIKFLKRKYFSNLLLVRKETLNLQNFMCLFTVLGSLVKQFETFCVNAVKLL